MKYKALFLDVDGTIVPYDFYAVPSDRLTQAIHKAQEKVTVCLVTGRSYISLHDVLEKLEFETGYLVADNGARVMDLASKELLYDKPLESEDVEKISEILWKENVEFFLKEGDDANFNKPPHTKGTPYGTVYNFYMHETITEERADEIYKKVAVIPTVTPYKSKHAHGYGVNIQHTQATKLHGVEVVMKKLGIKREEIIACGDSYNDFPLLMTAGLKVAMGNAIPELKDIADFVAPSVYDDGVATVIEKYIL